jgi:C4-dicarboxylate-specific signal transduction histidine kinase
MWGINIDRTREAELEQELKLEQLKFVKNAKLAALGEMAAGVAHEVNNPLAVIVGKVAILIRKASDQNFDWTAGIQDLQTIETTARRIAKIVNSLRTYSREAENDPFVEATVLEIIKDTFELCRERFNRENIGLLVQVPTSLSIRCRPAQISQVLMNLLNNSYDAVAGLDSRWIKIIGHQKNGRILLQVTDSGSGIPEAVIEKMMNPFFTTKEVGKGTGLGLSISTGIISTHGGVLGYDKSAPNTTFFIDLPDAKNFNKARDA